jgi:hypothetical protein
MIKVGNGERTTGDRGFPVRIAPTENKRSKRGFLKPSLGNRPIPYSLFPSWAIAINRFHPTNQLVSVNLQCLHGFPAVRQKNVKVS